MSIALKLYRGFHFMGNFKCNLTSLQVDGYYDAMSSKYTVKGSNNNELKESIFVCTVYKSRMVKRLIINAL